MLFYLGQLDGFTEFIQGALQIRQLLETEDPNLSRNRKKYWGGENWTEVDMKNDLYLRHLAEGKEV